MVSDLRPPIGAKLGRYVVQRAETKTIGTETLADLAKKIHCGDLSKSTTGIARLADGSLVAATQGSVEAVQKKAMEQSIPLTAVIKTYGAGYHCEVSLYLAFGDKGIKAMGASQGFCPHCQAFMTSKGITKEGPNRDTDDQVWRSPDCYLGKEKPTGSTYPWLYMLIEPENERKTFATKQEYEKWEAMRMPPRSSRTTKKSKSDTPEN